MLGKFSSIIALSLFSFGVQAASMQVDGTWTTTDGVAMGDTDTTLDVYDYNYQSIIRLNEDASLYGHGSLNDSGYAGTIVGPHYVEWGSIKCAAADNRTISRYVQRDSFLQIDISDECTSVGQTVSFTTLFKTDVDETVIKNDLVAEDRLIVGNSDKAASLYDVFLIELTTKADIESSSTWPSGWTVTNLTNNTCGSGWVYNYYKVTHNLGQAVINLGINKELNHTISLSGVDNSLEDYSNDDDTNLLYNIDTSKAMVFRFGEHCSGLQDKAKFRILLSNVK